MKNLKFLFVLIGILYVGINFMACEDEVADPPIEGVTAMKQNTGNPAVWSAEVDVAQLKNDFQNGNTARLSIPSGSSFFSCIKLVKEKNDCILAATGNWENTGETDNPLGDVECCREYYNRQLLGSNCLVTANFLDPVIEDLQEQLVRGEVGKTTAINLDFSDYPKAVENVNVGFLVHEEKHYIATSFEEKNGEGEAVQMTLMRSLNAATSETFATPNARFATPNTGGGGNGNLIIGGGTVEYQKAQDGNFIKDWDTVANCGGQGTDNPRIKTGNKKQLLGGNFCGSCISVCVPYTNPMELEMFMHIGHPINQRNAYHNDSIITKIFRVNKDDVEWNDFNDNYQEAIKEIIPTPYTKINNDSPAIPILIDSMLFKPYLKFVDTLTKQCPDTLKIKVNRIPIPLQFALTPDFFNNSNEIILVAAQIVKTFPGSNIPSLVIVNSDSSLGTDHANIPSVLENEVLLAFSNIESDQIVIKNDTINNIYICQTDTPSK